MIHIVFQRNDVEVLKKAIELEPSLTGEIFSIDDDFAVGPIAGIFTEEGIEARKQWWRDVLAGGDLDGAVDNGTVNDAATVEMLKQRLQEDSQEFVWIWAAQNKHDVCGYYWLMSQLKDFQGRVFILYLNNLPFINEKGLIFYPVNLFDIPAREFLKARKLARPITLSEFEIDPDEWNRLCQEDKGVRILEGGKKLSQYPYTFYDEELRKFITGDWIKTSKLINQFLSKAKQTTGDMYMLWRVKQLAAAGELDVQGELKGMKDFEIKAKSTVPAGEAVPQEGA
ncbi:MAG: DUF1835 domain-containing protein [Bacteroidetes bacterium]|nr:DUF1835 domain-containing protein [Bacteroidota bacterium]